MELTLTIRPALCAHRRGDGADHLQSTEDVDVKHRPHLGIWDLLDGALHGIAGVVDQHVDPSVPPECLRHGGPHRCRVGDVPGERRGPLEVGECSNVRAVATTR
jgi:hypothetical protein